MKTIAKLLSAIIILSSTFTGYANADISGLSNTGLEQNITNTINTQIDSVLEELDADIFNTFEIKVLKDNNVFLENGVWYTYNYTKYQGFGEGVIPTESSLKSVGFSKDSTILLLDSEKGAYFVTQYKKVKLISDYIISGISNKQTFLNELADDKKDLHEDTDELFLELKEDTLNLTKGLSDSVKIYKIYDYILNNVSYSEKFDTEAKEIFSGINTYKNNEGICGGYSKLNLYMLSFAGIEDVKVVRGYLIDTVSFPSIGHAWIQIGYKYYDSTFDDPIGNTLARTYRQYDYYGLDKDSFYVNKYEYGTLPTYLKTTTLKFRKNLVAQNILKLSDSYIAMK